LATKNTGSEKQTARMANLSSIEIVDKRLRITCRDSTECISNSWSLTTCSETSSGEKCETTSGNEMHISTELALCEEQLENAKIALGILITNSKQRQEATPR
jgi:hypothetical protein